MFKLITYKLLFIVVLIMTQTAWAQQNIHDMSYLSKTTQVAENIWIGPQPTEQDFKELATEEIGAIINTRTAFEMEQMSFSPVNLASEFNMAYDLLEIGKGHAYSPEKLASFNELMTANIGKKMVLHCRSGNRSTQLYTAWLIKYQGKSEAEALKAVGSNSSELNGSVKALLGR